MRNIVLDVDSVSKQYRLGEVGTGTISHDLNRLWARLRGHEDPFLKIGEMNDRSKKGESDYVWALRDLNFQIEQGDAVGIIGRNGAGKSTLLKLLSKVTAPTSGNIKVKGRIASLLEVGTGFHPEMTGRENIFLNGAILGMTKREIKKKFDEIVDFSGVERYIDTPVKRYSSGMYVRLAFAVAAHLESEILIVDEVLAVGDAEFQKKCLGKMGSISKGEGRTVLFVSHNMDSILNLCQRGVYLENGQIKYTGDINAAVRKYLERKSIVKDFVYEDDILFCNSINVFSNDKNLETYHFKNGETLRFVITFQLKKSYSDFGFCVALYDEIGTCISAINTYHINNRIQELVKGKYEMEIILPAYVLNTGEYSVNLHFNDKRGNLFKIVEDCLQFVIVEDGYRRGDFFIGSFPGALGLVPEINFI